MSTSLDELARAFLECTMPRSDWTHAAHLRVGAWHVHRYGRLAALPRLREGIRRLNAAHGTANTETAGYHETITAAYVELIAAFLSTSFAAGDPTQSLERHVERLLAGPLSDRAVLLRFWSREALMSPRARASWVPPDLAPLALPAEAGEPA